MNYREWEKTHSFSPVSPEATSAEDAWKAAVEEMRRVINAAYPTETTSAGLAMMLDTELDALL